ncbi:hypothetical protein [Micromonospora zamorensis]|uniref:hypothetical protein n=1 Tax=Micromonospora zamorensis TaxID=709883 RepID=UPI0033ABC919
MGSITSAEQADERFVEGLEAVARLRVAIGPLVKAKPQGREVEQLLEESAEVLKALQADLDKIKAGMPGEYDTAEFEALITEIIKVRDAIYSIPLYHFKEDLKLKLGTGWQPAPKEGFSWFRGATLDETLSVLQAEKFDSSRTYHGAYFGVGTYFARTYKGTDGYNKGCVFGLNLAPKKVLRIAEPGPWQLHAPRFGGAFQARNEVNGVQLDIDLTPDQLWKMKNAPNAASKVAEIARERGYDAVEVLASREGPLLVMLEDQEVGMANVVFIDLS